jgi:hypothetical protein
MTDQAKGPWFLLYGGTSTDGSGPGRYEGRTTDPSVALKHARRIDRSPYSTGHVDIITDAVFLRARSLRDFQQMLSETQNDER